MRFLAAFAAMWALDAHANSGIGFLVPAIPVILLGLVPAIFIEAFVLARALALPFRRATVLSLGANLASTVFGAFLAIVADIVLLGGTGGSGASGSRSHFLAALVPMFFATWAIEAWFVRSRVPPEARPGRAVLYANLLSYALLFAAVYALAPTGGPFDRRMRVTDVVNQMQVAKVEVAEYHTTHKAFPPPARLPTADSKILGTLERQAEGRIVATLAAPGVELLDGKTITLQPRVEGGQITAWDCRSNAPPKYLPANCR